jgi:nitrite reductase (NO-forming)
MSAEPKKPISKESVDAEPAADRTPVSLFLVVLFALLVYWGMVYLDDHGGSFDAKVYEPYASAAELANVQPPSTATATVKGRQIFNTICAACHQASGLGLPNQFPPLAGSDWVNAKSPDRVIRIVLNGLTGPITVSGQQLNLPSPMTPWKTVLTSDEDVAAVLTFVRQNKGWGNNAPAVAPEQVKAIRATLNDRDNPFTPEELLKIPVDK